MTIERLKSDKYGVYFATADIRNIANEVKSVPRDYINEQGNGISAKGLEYLAPLIIGELEIEYENGMPKHIII